MIRSENRNRRIICPIDGCKKFIRSDNIESHKRQHQRIYRRGEKGRFINLNSTVPGTKLTVPGTMVTVPGTIVTVPGTKNFTVPGTKNSTVPGTKITVPGTKISPSQVP